MDRDRPCTIIDPMKKKPDELSSGVVMEFPIKISSKPIPSFLSSIMP